MTNQPDSLQNTKARVKNWFNKAIHEVSDRYNNENHSEKTTTIQLKEKVISDKNSSVFPIKGDLRTICRFSYMKVYKLITLGTKFKTLLSLGRKITMFSKFITNYIEQGWWHSSLTLKCMHLLLKEVNKRGRHAYNLHGWTCLPSGIVMEIHCHITGIFEAAVRLRRPSWCSV